MSYFSLLRHEHDRKRRLQQLFVAAETTLLRCYLAAQGITGQTHRLTGTVQKMTSPLIPLLLHTFVAMDCLCGLVVISITEELLGRKNSGSGLEIREYDRRDPSR
jgi:hypothetical protein